MNLLILGAGYATRLYPLTLNQPKPLLPIAGQPMIEHVLDKLTPIPGIDRVLVVTNDKFAGHFERWAEGYRARRPDLEFKIVNDGTKDEQIKLGAIGDIHFVLEQEQLEDDLIVVAGDNLFSDSLEAFGEFCRAKQAPVLAVYDVGDLELVKQYNSISLDADDRITAFEEKCQDPHSTLTGIALYYYPKDCLADIRRYIAEGHNPDQPGRLIQWLYPQKPVYAWRVPGTWHDIGSKEELERADQLFSGQANHQA